MQLLQLLVGWRPWRGDNLCVVKCVIDHFFQLIIKTLFIQSYFRQADWVFDCLGKIPQYGSKLPPDLRFGSFDSQDTSKSVDLRGIFNFS